MGRGWEIERKEGNKNTRRRRRRRRREKMK